MMSQHVHPRVQRRERVLEDHLDSAAAAAPAPRQRREIHGRPPDCAEPDLARGGIDRSKDAPRVVVFPQPLSPTSARVSPSRTSKLTVVDRTPPDLLPAELAGPDGKNFFRLLHVEQDHRLSWTARLHRPAAGTALVSVGLLVAAEPRLTASSYRWQVTCPLVPTRASPGSTVAAPCDRSGSAGGRGSRRPGEWMRDGARDRRQLHARRLLTRDRAQQRPRVRVLRRMEDLSTLALSTTRPRYMTTTSSAISAMTPRSCVMSMIAIPVCSGAGAAVRGSAPAS